MEDGHGGRPEEQVFRILSQQLPATGLMGDTRIGPVQRAPLAHLFDLDAFQDRMRQMRGGHVDPLDAVGRMVGGVPDTGGAMSALVRLLGLANIARTEDPKVK